MKIKTIKLFLFISLQCFIFVSCQKPKKEEMLINANHVLKPPMKIDDGDPFLSILQWSRDSTSVSYMLNEDYRSYNINDHSIQKTAPPECIEHDVWIGICKPDIDRDFYSIPDDVSELDILVSPSDRWAIFKIYVQDENAVTLESQNKNYPDPVARPPMQDVYELWITHPQKPPREAGMLPACMYLRPLWASDESRVVIPRAVDIRKCGTFNYSAWIIDLEQGDMYPLIPEEEDAVETYVNALSPDGTQLLYSVIYNRDHPVSKLFIINLDTLEIDQLETPIFSQGIAWLAKNQILIKYTNDSNSKHLRPGLFNLESKTVIPLAASLDNGNYCINEYSVSPDMNWLAFVGSNECERGDSNDKSNWIRELWLIELNPLLANS